MKINITHAKNLAKAIAAAAECKYSEALEITAQGLGFANWQTLHAYFFSEPYSDPNALNSQAVQPVETTTKIQRASSTNQYVIEACKAHPQVQLTIARPAVQLLIVGAFLVVSTNIALLFNTDWKTSALLAALQIGGVTAIYTAYELLEWVAYAIRRRTAGHERILRTVCGYLLWSAITSGGMAWCAFLWPTDFISRHESVVTSTLLAILTLTILGLSVLWPADPH